MTVGRFGITWSVLLLSLCISCNSSDLIQPTYKPSMDPGRVPPVVLEQDAVQATSSTGLGSSVKAPTSASAVPGSHSRIDVTWQDNSTNETGFEVHRSIAGVSGAFALLTPVAAGITSYNDAGLTPSTEYCYKVRGYRTAGNKTSYSAFSTTACATTLRPPVPASPSGADVKPTNSAGVDVRWTDNSTNEEGFRVERSLDLGSTWNSASTTGPNVTSFQDKGLASEQQVCYRLTAFNGGGDSPPSNTDCTTPPAAPTDLRATGVDGPAVELTWVDNSTTEEAYVVLSGTNSPPVSIVAELPANSTTYRDASVSANATYQYLVRAKKDGGYSDDSNIEIATAGNCLPTSPEEVCDNGIDDDCDGAIDPYPQCPVNSCPCPLGYLCNFDDTCVPHCFDGQQNGGESDVDCGGDGCDARCATGQTCFVDADCASGTCFYGVCQP